MDAETVTGEIGIYPKAVDGLQLPATPPARAALGLAREFLDTPLLNHSARTYVWAAHYARVDGVSFDSELLFVASMLHDLALHDEFDAHTLPFEVMSANVATAFTRGAGWAGPRRARTAEIIRLHMMDDVPAAVDPEGYLIQAGVSADVSGARTRELPAALLAKTLAAWPRDGFQPRFIAAFRDQAVRKPDCAAAEAVIGGIEQRIVSNPLDA